MENMEIVMKIDFVSDLHLEINGMPKLVEPVDGDVLVLNGDILLMKWFQSAATDNRAEKGRKLFREFLEKFTAPYKHIFMIPGNHEYYSGHFFKGADEIFAENISKVDQRIKLMNNKFIDINGVRIICSTLWTDFNNDRENMKIAGYSMNDYFVIYLDDTKSITLMPQDTQQAFHENFAFIKQSYETRGENDVVVFTHHAPSYLSHNSKRYGTDDALMYAYCNNLDDFISSSDIKYWGHGHTHDNVDYKIGNTRIVSAMYGYDQHETWHDPRPMSFGRIEFRGT